MAGGVKVDVKKTPAGYKAEQFSFETLLSVAFQDVSRPTICTYSFITSCLLLLDSGNVAGSGNVAKENFAESYKIHIDSLSLCSSTIQLLTDKHYSDPCFNSLKLD